MKKKKRFPIIVLWGTGAVVVVVWFLISLSGVKQGSAAQGRTQLETALRRAAVACYAAEGSYPPSLDYLTEHYGVQIGKDYVVFYEVFASNLMPDITVLEKGVT